MSFDLDKSLKQRSRIRAAVTKLITRINSIISKDGSDIELQTVEDMLVAKFNSLRILDEQILNEIDEDKVEVEMGETVHYEVNVNTTLQMIRSRIKEKLNSNAIKTENSVRLPKLQLPTFGGSKAEWISFWDTFVHSTL